MTRMSAGMSVLRLSLLTALGIAPGVACQPPTNYRPETTAPQEEAAVATPCELAFGAACGAACSNEAPCAAGLHCQDGVCQATCIDTSDCEKGACSAEGRCVEASNIALMPFETDPGVPVDPPACIEGQVEFDAVMPQVWLLLDRSGSMTGLLGTTTRWGALGAVLLGNPADASDRGVVGEFEDRVAFGAVFYTTGVAATGCVLDLESVALAANSYTDIRQRYNKLGPSGGTPTADSIAATVAVAATSDLTGGPKILVLATDGAPGTCALRDQAATTEVENEVARAFGKGIETFAVSIATETDAPHMQRVTNIGVGLPADAALPAMLYTAESQDQLKLAFSTILADVPRSCVFALNGNVKAESADQGTVTLAGQTLVFGDANGWVLKQADQVELVGEACARIQAGEEALDITFPCAVFTPKVH